MRCKFCFVGLLVLILSSALAANAEVMDKEPSTLFHWASALLGGIGTIAAWRWRWWGGALVTLFGLLWLYASHLEIQDPFVGPAIRAAAWGVRDAVLPGLVSSERSRCLCLFPHR